MLPPIDAELVVRLRTAGCVFAEDEAGLLVEAAPDGVQREALVRRRLAGEPLEQVLGWAAFGGLQVPVRPGVFVPRRRTELLAERALAVTAPGAVVVELCCGAGAVSLVLLAGRPGLTLWAGDVDPVAVSCAAENLGGRATVVAGDLYAGLPADLRGRVDVLVANAPYVPTAAIALMPTEARDHEPAVSLDGGADGLDVLRRVVAEAPSWLGPGGHLLFECGDDQVEVVSAEARAAGLRPEVVQDGERAATVVVARAAVGPAPATVAASA